ncbi:nucleoid-associated protein YgaU [Kitasatospora sp. GP30]|uniref:LysM peptidoglycan-binding domain-containing protein n=1 Tax=Kitasatospora sp. GP30 TaxID=3035084 RepID=UPI000C7154C0|nr:nucleoid-associated protein YgaU [Kitasatospora sp. GP30]
MATRTGRSVRGGVARAARTSDTYPAAHRTWHSATGSSPGLVPQQAPVKQNTAPAPQPAKPAAPAAPKSDNGYHGHKAATGNGGSYTVKSGDTLSAIAAAHGTDWHTLYQKNASVIGDNPNLIFPGQVLSF